MGKNQGHTVIRCFASDICLSFLQDSSGAMVCLTTLLLPVGLCVLAIFDHPPAPSPRPLAHRSKDKVKQWATMEQTLQRYKQKLDESADVRKRAKEADDARAEQAERALKAEEECAKLRYVSHDDSIIVPRALPICPNHGCILTTQKIKFLESRLAKFSRVL
jgi:hypothetical protein